MVTGSGATSRHVNLAAKSTLTTGLKTIYVDLLSKATNLDYMKRNAGMVDHATSIDVLVLLVPA